MLDLRVRWLITAVLLVACAPAQPEALAEAHAYENDVAARRAAMEASVAAADTPYAELRLAHYGTDWEALPVFAPRVRRLVVRGGTASELDEGSVIEAPADDLDAYVAAGARAFERQPVQIDLALAALRDRATAERSGFRVEADGVVRGAIEVDTSTGWNVALTCAGCHAADRDGTFVLGLPNERLDLGTLEGHLDWPLGTMDVTDDGVDAPLRPADLRPIASQARLQHTGNLFNGRIARMVRIETLAITQLERTARPERFVVASIALFLESLDAQLPRPNQETVEGRHFERSCGGCHVGEPMASALVPVETVGTDARATTGGERGTGGYRAPSLLGVGDRRGVLHDGTASSLRGLLGLEASQHVGHPFGRELTEADREALAAWLTR